MKKVFLVLINVVVFCNLFSQSSLYKEWYSSDIDLKIAHNKSTINSFHNFDKTIVTKQNDCTLLTFIKYNRKEGSLKRCKEISQFKIIKINNDTLILSAVNENSKGYFGHQDPIVFTSHIWLGIATPNFHFQNLTFKHISSLGYTTEIYEIDSIGNVIYTSTSILNTESYSGTLKSPKFSKLIELLSCYDFSKYNNKAIDIDAPYLFIEIQHNNTISKMESQCYLSKTDKINVLLDFVLSLKDFFTN